MSDLARWIKKTGIDMTTNITDNNHSRIGITLVVLDELPDLVWSRRAELGVTLRAAGQLTGVPFNTIKRFENREGGITVDTAVKLLQWVREGSQTNIRPKVMTENP